MCWLPNFLSARGEGLRAGDAITTGSYAGAIEVPAPGPLHVFFGGLGEISVELVAAE
jgi:2-keto-4-pentenoate hydratase